eukprot:TRINITY_DN23212_c0_g2_i4.p1 TRINITY_DN23212_c0_g2~~TRINITY_DN23212_c0_g2_i4.p1  ORF type:complete len:210 (+),score=-14.75 TRINITY_DN23212_c0_g2_i4:29-631(+)
MRKIYQVNQDQTFQSHAFENNDKHNNTTIRIPLHNFVNHQDFQETQMWKLTERRSQISDHLILHSQNHVTTHIQQFFKIQIKTQTQAHNKLRLQFLQNLRQHILQLNVHRLQLCMRICHLLIQSIYCIQQISNLFTPTFSVHLEIVYTPNQHFLMLYFSLIKQLHHTGFHQLSIITDKQNTRYTCSTLIFSQNQFCLNNY